MRKKLFVMMCLSTAAAGCGQASEENLNEQFDDNFRSSCISSATAGGALTTELATQASDCALATINERYSTSEKLTLTDEQAQPIAMECFQKVMPANG